MMERSENNQLKRISAIEAFPRLLESVFFPDDEEAQALKAEKEAKEEVGND